MAEGEMQGRACSQVFSRVVSEGNYQEYDPEDSVFNISVKRLKGDINEDGQVTIADVTALVNIILGK